MADKTVVPGNFVAHNTFSHLREQLFHLLELSGKGFDPDQCLQRKAQCLGVQLNAESTDDARHFKTLEAFTATGGGQSHLPAKGANRRAGVLVKGDNQSAINRV